MSFPSSSQDAQSSLSLESPQPCRQFTFAQIQQATRDFAVVIGHGGFGQVYKGTVSNGSRRVDAAIKRLDSTSKQGSAEFWVEVEMLSNLTHCHLVSLIGYCNDGQERILVYEYMPNGSLEDRLHKRPTTLTLMPRLKICLGAARGLYYLHTNGVIHRDVKSSNILLENSWAAKISDFGLSKICQKNQQSTDIKTKLKGTRGYLDPYNINSGTASRKSDVYAFGVVLLEVFCGKKALDKIEDYGLAAWGHDAVKKGKVKQIVDLNIRGSISSKCLQEFAGLAGSCLRSPEQRPTMEKVVKRLEWILASQEKANQMKIFGKVVPKFLFPSSPESSVERKNITFLDICNVEDENQMLRRFGFDTICDATKNFSLANRIDGFHDGDHGYLYKGKLEKVQDIAIFGPSSHHTVPNYLHEAWILLQVKHENLIQLLGYCVKGTGIYLIYDFAPYETLSSLLFDTNYPQLGWDERYKIVLGVARALVYLQQHAPSRIIHGYINPSNILLDEQMNPKLSNFKFAVRYKETETTGYKPRENITQGRLSAKTDVYDFGVVVLEILCGHRVSHRTSMGSQDFIWSNWVEGTYSNIVDPRINTNVDSTVMKRVIQIGLLCMQDNITMEEVVSMLIGTSSMDLRVPKQPWINLGDELMMREEDRL